MKLNISIKNIYIFLFVMQILVLAVIMIDVKNGVIVPDSLRNIFFGILIIEICFGMFRKTIIKK